MLLNIWLIFCQFQSGVACESVAYKKMCVMAEIFTFFDNLFTVLSYMETFSFNNMVDCCGKKRLKVTGKVSE